MAQKKAKLGRPRLPKGTAKGRIVPVRFTADDLKAIAEASRASKQTVSALVRNIVMSAFAWVVDCKACGKEFAFRDIDPNHPREVVNNMPANEPAKPQLRHGAEHRTCPHCNSTSIYKRGDLRFKAN